MAVIPLIISTISNLLLPGFDRTIGMEDRFSSHSRLVMAFALILPIGLLLFKLKQLSCAWRIVRGILSPFWLSFLVIVFLFLHVLCTCAQLLGKVAKKLDLFCEWIVIMTVALETDILDRCLSTLKTVRNKIARARRTIKPRKRDAGDLGYMV